MIEVSLEGKINKGKPKVMISVAMAVFNGERYLKEQVDSILEQSLPIYEVVVSLDKSQDGTLKILNKYSFLDSRVKIFEGPNKGVVENFENAIEKCTGDIIFLCDQDDVWYKNKVELVVKEFKKDSEVSLVLHDAVITDEDLDVLCKSFFEKNHSKSGKIRNIIKNSYVGACMAFKKEIKKSILPFPKHIPMHDQWIGLMAEFKGKVKFLKEPLIKYRRHKNTVTGFKHSNFLNMVKWRLNLVKSFLTRE